MAWVLDPPLGVLRAQLVAASGVPQSEFGTIAGASHRQSGPHYPEYPPPPGNPPYEVDALDIPHVPGKLDVGVVGEALRQSHAAGRDRRLRLFIFNRRIWSSYDHAEGPAYTWRPYREDDPHDTHGHAERNDSHRDDLSPFEIGIDMAPFLAPLTIGDRGDHVEFLQYCLAAIHAARNPTAKPLWPVVGGVAQIPGVMDKTTGDAMKRLLSGGNGKDFGPLLAARLLAAMGEVNGKPGPQGIQGVKGDPGDPGAAAVLPSGALLRIESGAAPSAGTGE